MRKLFLWLALASPVLAWDARGHLVVDAIAWEYLDATTRGWVEDCLQQHPDPLARNFEGASLWPDRVREEWPESRPWHYINQPLLGPGLSSAPAPAENYHVVQALESWRRIAVEEPERRAEALAFLIHFVADVHQPLHACSYYSQDYPGGDEGGRRILLVHPWCKNLHQFWDLAGYSPELSASQVQAEVQRVAVNVSTRSWDPQAWARESYEAARAVAYPFGWPPGSIGEEYAEQVRRTCRQRLHLAGLRLASTLYRLGPNARVPRPEF